MRIGIVGGGISGLVVAHRLAVDRRHREGGLAVLEEAHHGPAFELRCRGD